MDFNIGIAESLGGIVSRMMIFFQTGKALTILGLAFFTFKFLDLFLETNIVIAKKHVDATRMRALFWALAIITVMITPVILIITNFTKLEFKTIVGLFIFSIVGGKICGLMLKRYLRPGDPRRQQSILLLEATKISVEIIAENIAYWIQDFAIKLINLFLNVIRAPFISYYVLVGTILNLALSVVLMKFMGSSQIAGEANIIGSLIGGIAHAIVRHKHIKELKAELDKEEVTNETNNI